MPEALEVDLLLRFLDPKAPSLPKSCLNAGRISLEGSGLLELLGFASSAGDETSFHGVEVWLYEEKSEDVKLPIDEMDVPLTYRNLAVLVGLSVSLSDATRRDVERLWNAVRDREDGIPLRVFQSRSWDLVMVQEMYRWFASVLGVESGMFEETIRPLAEGAYESPATRFVWAETLQKWRKDTREQKRMAAWLGEVDGLVERVRKALDRFKDDERIQKLPAMEALGAYVRKGVDTMNQRNYLLPSQLSTFQRELYIHLIEWKWRTGMKEAGEHGKEVRRKYDAIMTPEDAKKRLLIYDEVRDRLDQHHARYPFRFHKHFKHMASSQAACVNLFLPPLVNGADGEAVLRAARPDLARVDRDQLDKGFCIEYWGAKAGESPGKGKRVGLLNDKTEGAGTDCDIAIAYRDHDNRLCLWMIEHKLTEAEFTTCGAYNSDGRKKARRADPSAYDCGKSLPEIIADKDTCYYH